MCTAATTLALMSFFLPLAAPCWLLVATTILLVLNAVAAGAVEADGEND